jgi:hypothetical protein
MPSFQLIGLPYRPFAPLFELSDLDLSKMNIHRVFATQNPGYPCRVSLADADVGEELLLLPYPHQAADSPYKASGPIFVRKAAVEATIDPGVIPNYVRGRMMSVRAYDSAHLMTDATVCAGGDASVAIQRMFDAAEVSYLHLHNANRGCFSCTVIRTG